MRSLINLALCLELHFENSSRSRNNHYYFYGEQHQIRPKDFLCAFILSMLLRGPK